MNIEFLSLLILPVVPTTNDIKSLFTSPNSCFWIAPSGASWKSSVIATGVACPVLPLEAATTIPVPATTLHPVAYTAGGEMPPPSATISGKIAVIWGDILCNFGQDFAKNMHNWWRQQDRQGTHGGATWGTSATWGSASPCLMTGLVLDYNMGGWWSWLENAFSHLL